MSRVKHLVIVLAMALNVLVAGAITWASIYRHNGALCMDVDCNGDFICLVGGWYDAVCGEITPGADQMCVVFESGDDKKLKTCVRTGKSADVCYPNWTAVNDHCDTKYWECDCAYLDLFARKVNCNVFGANCVCSGQEDGEAEFEFNTMGDCT